MGNEDSGLRRSIYKFISKVVWALAPTAIVPIVLILFSGGPD